MICGRALLVARHFRIANDLRLAKYFEPMSSILSHKRKSGNGFASVGKATRRPWRP